MQFLGIVPHLFPYGEHGEKRSTIRWRKQTFVPGPLTCVCDGEPERRFTAIVTRVTTMPLSQVADHLGRTMD
jgi:hypothetical protein